MNATISSATSDRRTRYETLLGTWCDSLLDLQVGEANGKRGGLRGGILCPACSRIHGRCADAVYPFLFQARARQSDAYRDAAIHLLDWSDRVTTSDGAFQNEPVGNGWKGITVFSLLALGEALRHHGDLLPEAVQERWRDRLRRGADFLIGYIDDLWKSNVNYPISCAAALAVAAEVLGNTTYRQRAHDLMRECLPYFDTENSLLFGEGKPMDGTTPRGCRAIDLGYNVEESLPNLALCAHLLGDDEARSVAACSFQNHLSFLLPDGAWDNSWGARSFKWTYWGSRTSDGCQSGLALLADTDDRFMQAADRNLSLIEACTHNGILYGGPHLAGRGELPCIHHTFCHAKALAAALDTAALQPTAEKTLDTPAITVSLPRDTAAEPIRLFPEIATGLMAHGEWRATVTGYDWKYTVGEEHPSGGALSLLWHTAIGPVFAASMTVYREIEPSNSQPWRGSEPPFCLTPQLLLKQKDTVLRSILDTKAQIDYKAEADSVTATVRGHLTDGKQRLFTLLIPFQFRYSIKKDGVEITAKISAGWLKDDQTAVLRLPLIAASTETIRVAGDRQIILEKPGGRLTVEASVAFTELQETSYRTFNPVPGFEAYPLQIPLASGQEVVVRLGVG